MLFKRRVKTVSFCCRSVRCGLRTISAAGARHVAYAVRAAAVRRTRPPARLAGSARGRLPPDVTKSEYSTPFLLIYSWKMRQIYFSHICFIKEALTKM